MNEARAVRGKGASSALVRDVNERRVLSALRRLGPATIADVAAAAYVLPNTTWRILEDLGARGLVMTSGRRTGGRGMPASLVRIDPNGAYAFGHFVGRDRIETALMDLSGQVRAARSVHVAYPMPETALATIAAQREAVEAEMAASGPPLRARLCGVGLAIPANLGGWSQEIEVPPEAVEAWRGVDLGQRLAALSELPVTVENDGTAAAVGELFQGLGRTLHTFVYVFIGPSTGGGVVLRGSYWRGETGTAGDFGLMPVPLSGLPSATPARGPSQILTATAALSALLRLLRHHGVAASFDTLEEALTERPDLEDLWIEDALAGLVPALLAAVCIIDPEAVVLAGNAPEPILTKLRERLAPALAAAAPEGRHVPPVLAGQVGGNAPVFGAATLPLHRRFSLQDGALGA